MSTVFVCAMFYFVDSTPKYDKWIILEKYLIWCFHSQVFSRTVVDWFMCLGIEHHRFLSCSLYIYTLMDGFHLPIFHLTHMSFCRQGLPGVAESTVSISEGTPFSWGEGARQGGWGVRKSVFVWPSPTVFHGLLSPGWRGLCWMMDSATPLSAPRRMTGGVN